MSILGQSPQQLGRGEILFLCAWGALALLVAAWGGFFRRRSIVGPPRVGEREPLGPVLVILAGGFLLWLMLPVLVLGASSPHSHTATQAATSPPSPAPLVSSETLILASTMSAAIAFAAMLLANRLLRGSLRPLGITLARFGPGLLAGLAASVVAVWAVFVAANLSELLWRFLHYQHPQAHDLLQMLGRSQRPIVSALLLASATLVAPIFEETLFRGHLQTLITYGLARWIDRLSAHPAAARGFSVILPIDPLAPVASDDPPAPIVPSSAVRWASILLTSLAFALVHPVWTMPPIFILSLALGYIYERTGNLWAAITVHATFNVTSTAIYLLLLAR